MVAVAVGAELSVLAVAVLAAAIVNAVAPRSEKPARAIVRTSPEMNADPSTWVNV
jgi:hypothetical protein